MKITVYGVAYDTSHGLDVETYNTADERDRSVRAFVEETYADWADEDDPAECPESVEEAWELASSKPSFADAYTCFEHTVQISHLEANADEAADSAVKDGSGQPE